NGNDLRPSHCRQESAGANSSRKCRAAFERARALFETLRASHWKLLEDDEAGSALNRDSSAILRACHIWLAAADEYQEALDAYANEIHQRSLELQTKSELLRAVSRPDGKSTR